MMKTSMHLSSVLIASVAVTVLCATDSTGAPPTDAKGSGNPALATLRDPFWPIGWAPPKVTVTDVEEVPKVVQKRSPVRWEDARKLIHLSGLSKTSDGRYLAILKGIGVVEESDVVTVTLDDFTYKWRITKITEEGIAPERIGVYPKK